MTKLTTDFTDRASASTLLGASLGLIVADTRGGMDASTKAALAVVEAASGNSPARQDYLQRYTEAAGGTQLAMCHSAPGNKM